MSKRVKATKSSAFTLIDVMMTIGIVGILAAIAFPSYRAYNIRTHRAEVETMMMQDAAFMERLYTEAGCYNPGQDANGNRTVCGNAAIVNIPCPPLPYCQSPVSGVASYNIGFVVLNGNAYTLRATPVAGSSQEKDGIVQITSTGVQWWDKNNNGALDAGEESWLKR